MQIKNELKNIGDIREQTRCFNDEIEKIQEFLAPCVHGVEYAKTRPYLCVDCAYNYIQYCKCDIALLMIRQNILGKN